ncbi:RsmB/NOP family class I SAM-dependent RNA methyltransferase [Gynurincola endophyticus]|uniref:Fmu (Sun) domain-containing protein n=1 Tax=Gynurincola endophyticus TaxID=2479004 RepID=UPI000F8E65C7|nr:Fmu (Sun) domain-containing protein [Gynurincola endophyticus]
MRYFAHLQTALQLLRSYNGAMPFAAFAKQFFARHKKYGSKDRKSIAHLCYCYFRLGHYVQSGPTEEMVVLGLWLCSPAPNPVLQQLNAALNDTATLSIEEKLKQPVAAGVKEQLFPFQQHFSNGINTDRLVASYFVQPDVFLRIRSDRNTITSLLESQQIPYQFIRESSIAIPNNVKVDELLPLNEKVVIQDASSQEVGDVIKTHLPFTPKNVWDCCAASGGKSIMLYDLYPSFKLTVSDIRSSIMFNLQKRFHQAKIKQYASFVADLTQPVAAYQEYDFIIADVPCSGSGTWGRTPEQLVFFKEEEIHQYAQLQAQIVKNILPALKKGGCLAYCTCSVFLPENERQLQRMQDKFGLKLIHQQLITGYENKADSLFIALLQKV